MAELLRFVGKSRGILHVSVGNETWEPSVDDILAIQEMVLSADADPAGGVLVTRAGVTIEYLSPSGQKMPSDRFLQVTVYLPDGQPPTVEQLTLISNSVVQTLNEYYAVASEDT